MTAAEHVRNDPDKLRRVTRSLLVRDVQKLGSKLTNDI